jgi:hypothetical protein
VEVGVETDWGRLETETRRGSEGETSGVREVRDRRERWREGRWHEACVLFIIRPSPRRWLTIPFRSVWEVGLPPPDPPPSPFRLGRPARCPRSNHRKLVVFDVLELAGSILWFVLVPIVAAWQGHGEAAVAGLARKA